MLRIDPRDDADLLWFYNSAVDEIGPMASSWPAEVRARAERSTLDVGLRCGPVHVGSGAPHAQSYQFDGRAVGAATRYKRIGGALQDAGPRVELILRLRYRERLLDCRIPFGYAGSAAMRARPQDFALGVQLNPLRGAGAVAHLADAAQGAYRLARTTLSIERWTDRLGQKLASVGASEAERSLQRAIVREAEALVLSAWTAYRREARRVPMIVRRRAAARGPGQVS